MYPNKTLNLPGLVFKCLIPAHIHLSFIVTHRVHFYSRAVVVRRVVPFRYPLFQSPINKSFHSSSPLFVGVI